MRFAGLAHRNLRRRPARSILAATGIGVAVAGFVALAGLSQGMERAFVATFLQRDTHIVATRGHTVEIMTAVLDEALADRLHSVDGVSAVAGELYDLVETASGLSAMMAGWPEDSYLWRTLTLQAGRLPSAGERDGVVIGDVAADALGAQPGARVMIGNHQFAVVGVFRGNGSLSGKFVVTPLKTLQALLGREGQVTLFNLRVAHPDDRGAVAATRTRLAAAFPALRFSLAGEVGRSNGPLRLLETMGWATSTVALLIAVFVVVNTLLMSVTERKREVGVLTAVGWARPRIVALIVLEGITLAAMGGLVGAGIGAVGLHSLARTPLFSGFLQVEVGALIPRILLAILVVGALGSAYPAWRAARLPAVDALRPR